MPRLADHSVELGVFLGLFAVAMGLGFWAARWRQPQTMYNLDEWGLGGRSFGPVLSWFLVSGDLYTAYTFIALPATLYAVGAVGFFAVPFAAITLPLVFVAVSRMWSVSHVHGLVTPADFVRVRFGSPWLSLLVALTGIIGVLPYIALQLVGMEAVFAVMGLDGPWPLWAAFGILALFTYNAGLRAPALMAILKDILMIWVVLAALLIVASKGGWTRVFDAASDKFAASPSRGDGLLLSASGYVNFATLVLGSALALFLYPHAMTGVLAAKDRATVRRMLVTLPVYTIMLGIVALFGYMAISEGVAPLGANPATGSPGDRNTIMPRLFDVVFPDWVAGTAYAAVVIGAFVPAAIMSIAAANLFTRNIYVEFFRPQATPAEQTRVSRLVSLTVKFGAVAIIVFLAPQFSLDLQLIGGVIILQTLPPVAIGLFSAWLHRHALVVGMVTGLVVGLVMLYQIPQLGADGRVIRAHFGGSAWPLTHLGIDGGYAVYAGLLALAVNLAVAVVATPVLRLLRVPDGRDITWRRDYLADEGRSGMRRLDELLDGRPVMRSADEVPARHASLGEHHPYPPQWPLPQRPMAEPHPDQWPVPHRHMPAPPPEQWPLPQRPPPQPPLPQRPAPRRPPPDQSDHPYGGGYRAP
jgi:solute:Na+ symporter, SSS family